MGSVLGIKSMVNSTFLSGGNPAVSSRNTFGNSLTTGSHPLESLPSLSPPHKLDNPDNPYAISSTLPGQRSYWKITLCVFL